MEEAVEICKLRLFLKLVAQLERYDQIEPLPDIDFNVRAGNTLVGFTSLETVRQAMTVMPNGQHRQVFPEDQAVLDRINEQAEIASAAFNQFRWQQAIFSDDAHVTSEHKAELRSRLRSLDDELGLPSGRRARHRSQQDSRLRRLADQPPTLPLVRRVLRGHVQWRL